MDTQQTQNQEEFEDLESIENIDERILNTPAEEEEIRRPTINEDQQLETFLQFNRTPEVKTDEGIVLDLAGEKSEIKTEDITEENSSNLLRKITGQELQADELVNPGAILIIIMVAITLFGFLLMNFKRSEEIMKMQREIDKLKGRTNSIL